MLKVPYFSRVWIIEEVTVASDFAIIWGDITISKLATLYYKLSDVDVEKGLLVSFMLLINAIDIWDKIFALIELAGNKSYDLIPNYSKSKADIFLEFAYVVIVAENNLNIFDYSYVEDPIDPE
ncbi:unnamed protein product [Fusarium fujikuroi]|uniref:Heterokaryon incompatibility domain-containing protein n=1 Tax=Fusarium fujikuroi TaxID=5127 RepID=A0A9Q9UCK8_FUSFU|nr:unnamed protein product [Fusarium fujikuroi]